MLEDCVNVAWVSFVPSHVNPEVGKAYLILLSDFGKTLVNEKCF